MVELKFINTSDSFKNEVNQFIEEWFNSDEFIQSKTSGSTGEPKKIEILKSKMKESALMTGKFLNLQKKETALLCLSTSTIAGKMMIVRSLELGLKLVIVEPCSNPFEFIEEGIDFAAIVPLQLTEILKKNPEKLKIVRNVIVGGGSVSEEIEEQLKKQELTVFQTFGMTETISHIAMRKIGLHKEEHYSALEGNSFSIEDNQLIVHSSLLDGFPLKTNDCVELINAKQFIWKGRIDFVINSGGIKIQPEEIERKLSKLIKNSFFITGKKDAILGEKVILCIESENTFEIQKSELVNYLSKYEIPKEIYFFKQFIFTESNKINRLKTVDLYLKDAIQQIL